MDGDIHSPPLVGVKILDTDEIESCIADEVALKPPDLCIVETAHGIDLGEVVSRSEPQLALFQGKGICHKRVG